MGTYRNQVFDKSGIGIRAAPPHHGGIIKEKYMKRGEPCPIVTVVGADPLMFLSSCVEGPIFGQSELDWAGGVRGEPIEVIQGELTGLPIPAHAEIALEGFITTDEYAKEGPYGEWMGYYQDGYPKDRVIRIGRIYHRNDPIILGCPQGKPPHEDNRFLVYLRSGMIWDQLEKAGVPGVVGVWCPPEAGNRLMTVVALTTQYLGHAKQAALIASQCGGGIDMNRDRSRRRSRRHHQHSRRGLAIAARAIERGVRSSKTPAAAASTWPLCWTSAVECQLAPDRRRHHAV